MYTQIVTLILKNFRLILLACVLVGCALALWQYISTQVTAKTSQADAQAASAAIVAINDGQKSADKATRAASDDRASIRLREQKAKQQAEKVQSPVLEQPLPLKTLEAINAS